MNYLKGSLFLSILAALTGYLYKKWTTSLPVRVSGFVDPRFRNVEAVFRKNFESGAETGAAFAVYYKGDLVVDLWGGYANKEGQIPWRKNAMSVAFSTSKGITAILVARFMELGYLDFKMPVGHYWPEFAQNGKDGITVEMLVSHQAGVIGIDEPLSIRLMKSDYERYTSLLAAQKPFWKPGTKFGYHMLSWGFYVDVLLMKADPKNRTLDQIFQEEIAEPFGIDFFQGPPPSEHYRIVPRVYIQSLWHQLHILTEKDFWRKVKYSILDEHGYQTAASRACADFLVDNVIEASQDYELRMIPFSSFNGYGTARGIAKLYGIISNDGVYKNKTLLKGPTLDSLDEVVVQGKDVVIGTDLSMGRGFMIMDSPTGSIMFGHPGSGGQMGVGDRQNNVGIAYLTNNLGASFIGEQYINVRDALYRSLKQIQDR